MHNAPFIIQRISFCWDQKTHNKSPIMSILSISFEGYSDIAPCVQNRHCVRGLTLADGGPILSDMVRLCDCCALLPFKEPRKLNEIKSSFAENLGKQTAEKGKKNIKMSKIHLQQKSSPFTSVDVSWAEEDRMGISHTNAQTVGLR